MKTAVLIIGAATFIAQSLFGQGADIIIRERAKELRNQNNVRQGVAPPTQQPQAPSAADDAASLRRSSSGIGGSGVAEREEGGGRHDCQRRDGANQHAYSSWG